MKQIKELHIYSEKSSTHTKISIKDKNGEILFECCHSNDVFPSVKLIESLKLSLEGNINISFHMKKPIPQNSESKYNDNRIICEQVRSESILIS